MDLTEYKAEVPVWPLSHEKLCTMGIWLDENAAGDWVYQAGAIHFEVAADATFFKLKFPI